MNKELAIKYECDENTLTKAIQKIRNGEEVLYAMSGKMAVGKDTLGDLIMNELQKMGKEVIKFSYSTPIKLELSQIINSKKKGNSNAIIAKEMNVSEENIGKVLELAGDLITDDIFNNKRSSNLRLSLQYWGTDVRRAQNSRYWVNASVKYIIDNINKSTSVFVSDARFFEEAESILDLKGKIIRLEVNEDIRISRIIKRDNLIPTDDQLNHISETALDNYGFDKLFDGTSNLDELLKESLKYIIN